MIHTCANLDVEKKFKHTNYNDDRHNNQILKIIMLVQNSRNSDIPMDVNILCQ